MEQLVGMPKTKRLKNQNKNHPSTPLPPWRRLPRQNIAKNIVSSPPKNNVFRSIFNRFVLGEKGGTSPHQKGSGQKLTEKGVPPPHSGIFRRLGFFIASLRGALKMHFRKNLGIWPNKGWGGLTKTQVFVEIFQNQICLGKWPEM